MVSEVTAQVHPSPQHRGARRGNTRQSRIRSLVEALALSLFVISLVLSLVGTYRITGSSMQPTLRSGDRVLVSKAIYLRLDQGVAAALIPGRSDSDSPVYLFHPPQRGDVVLLKPPVDQGWPVVKRVVALPGERVAVHSRQVFINDQALEEPYLSTAQTYSYPSECGHTDCTYTVAPGQIFVLGDNRNSSADSHLWGAVPLDSVIGKVSLVYWPTTRAKFLSRGTTQQGGNITFSSPVLFSCNLNTGEGSPSQPINVYRTTARRRDTGALSPHNRVALVNRSQRLLALRNSRSART